MRNRFFPPLFVLLALVAAACGGTAEVATDSADSSETPAEETAEEVAEVADEPAETSTIAPETTTTAPVESTTSAPPDTEPDPNQTTTPTPTDSVDGQAIYESNCARCHGSEGEGGRGSVLQGVPAGQPDTAAGIDQVINGGNGMPAFGESLTMEEIVAAVDYIWATF